MKNRNSILIISVILLGLSASFVFITAFAQAYPLASVISGQDGFIDEHRISTSPDALPLRFQPGNWPWYAQGEISLDPEAPIPGTPVKICAGVINDDPNTSHVAMLQFGVAPLGIGVPYFPVGDVEFLVPPGGYAQGCTMWMKPLPGNWGIEVLLFQEDTREPLRSLRNIDLWEPLVPGEAHDLVFQIGPLGAEGTFTLAHIARMEGWEFTITPSLFPINDPFGVYTATLTTIPPAGIVLGSNMPIVDVEGFLNGQPIGGFRKIDSPAVPLHVLADPGYAEREITVDPYPLNAGEPTQVCVVLRNPTDDPQDVNVQYAWANFGVGLPFTPIDGLQPVHLPAHSMVKHCIHWVPPVSGHLCLQVMLIAEGYQPQFSQRNIDVNEPLRPGEPDALTFAVGNPFGEPVTITLGMIPHVEGWSFELSQDVLPAMQPGETRDVTLTVTPPAGQPLPPDGSVIVDVEAYANGMLIGGFRKVFRPPVPIHVPGDPIYAEREITVDPYPLNAGEPTQICVVLRNPSDDPQDVNVQYAWANFGVGLPFTLIDGLQPVHLPAHSMVKHCIHWVPPVSGHLCLQVMLIAEGYQPQFSQRNIDVNEPLQPGEPDALTFMVGNPFGEPVTITLGMIPHVTDWGFELSQDVLPAMQPGESRAVTLTVTPPAGEPLPPDGSVIVDVEAYAKGMLIGGFRKTFRPPVPIHQPGDPVYAESEIGVDPYPAISGVQTKLSVELFNPTSEDHVITATFSIAAFGIGLPFETDDITPNPVQIYVPANGSARGYVVWTPPEGLSKFCVKVSLEMEGYDLIWSQRNIDVGEPLQPGVTHEMTFTVGSGDTTEPVTITLGMVTHKGGWQVSLSEDVLENIQPGEIAEVVLSVTPPITGQLGSGEPIVDVEAYVEGKLLGGIRKLDVPPVPIHKPHEKVYAESEILIDPDPPQQGETTLVSAVLQNTSDVEAIVNVQFGWANFGMGIPFTTTGMVDPERTITLSPMSVVNTIVNWTPTISGHQCLQVNLTDPEGIYAPQLSQRNVEVSDRPDCGMRRVYTATIMNDSPLTVTVDIGQITFNVPPDWEITIEPNGSIEVGPYDKFVLTVYVTIPCPTTDEEKRYDEMIDTLQAGSGSTPTIDVEGYVDGRYLGGVEFQLRSKIENMIYLPLMMK